jgi:hypothetical protein
MSACSNQHREVNEMGIGKCSVPMWCGGGPAGFCDKPAYGERPPCREFRDGWTGELRREDGRYNGYVPGLACPAHGGPSVRTFVDGNAWCAVRPDFTNLQESPAGFGATRDDAITALRAASMTPAAKEGLPAVVGELVAIGELIRTQDNRITDSPIFIVQQKRKICGVDADYTNHFEWIDPRDTSEVYDDAAKAERDAEREEEGLTPIEWIRGGYIEIWEFVTACFTEQGCKDYLALNGHNLRQPRIYAEGSYRNQEWRAVRSYLMSLSALTAEAGKGGVTDAMIEQFALAFFGDDVWDRTSIHHNAKVLRDQIKRGLTAAISISAEEEWRCFYCDEVFSDREAAALHFGNGNGYTSEGKPGCQIDLAEYRRMEAKEARYAEEDADCHRAMRRQETEHKQALQRAEEAGYAKGLRDSGKCPCATTPASAEPGELTDADVDRAVYAFNTHRRNHPEQWNEAMRAALATLACRPDARGGGQAVAVGEVREYGFVIYTHIKMPPAGTKLYTHPTPAALDAERLDWLEAQFKDGVHVEGCYSGNFDAGTIKRCATVFYGTEEQRGTSIREVIDAARATTGARHE